MNKTSLKNAIFLAAAILTHGVTFGQTNKLLGMWILESCTPIEMKSNVFVQTGAENADPCKSDFLKEGGAFSKLEFKSKFLSLANDQAEPTKYIVESDEVILENDGRFTNMRFKFGQDINKTTLRYNRLGDKAVLIYARVNPSPLPQQIIQPTNKK